MRNPTFIDTFSEEELKDIYKQFKAVCVKFLEEDVKWTGKKGKSMPMASKQAKKEPKEAERRYA